MMSTLPLKLLTEREEGEGGGFWAFIPDGNRFDNECGNERLSVLVVLLPFCHSVPGTRPLFRVIK